MKKTPLRRKTKLKSTKSRGRGVRGRGGARSPSKRPSKKKLTITKLKKLLWDECKRIVRKRYQNTDGTWDCYTCGKQITEPKNAHTGHFIPSSVSSTELRYCLDNLKIQDYRCNINLSGNWVAYEAHLIVDHGRDFPDQLKKRNEETKGRQYDSLWYLSKIEEYKKL